MHGGRLVDFSEVLKKCQRAGFVKIEKNQIELTSRGRAFLSLNPAHSFELDLHQKEYIASHIFF